MDISPVLKYRLEKLLVTCEPFATDAELRALFVDARLHAWRGGLPNSESPLDRVDDTIAYLLGIFHTLTGENALVLFLRVLCEQILPGDARQHELRALADELELVLPAAQASEAQHLRFRTHIYSLLSHLFDETALADLCFALGVDYDTLPGDHKRGKVRELIEKLDRQGRLVALVEAAQSLRPDIAWEVEGGSQMAASPAVAVSVVLALMERVTGRARQPFEPEMVHIPAGEFAMGSTYQTDPGAMAEELPQHRLYLGEYWLSRTPVTRRQYAAFVQATGYVPTARCEGGGWVRSKTGQSGEDIHPQDEYP
ncbi:MAG: SUMF1/EgtB/PvdO family nonheme iron enzyme, partial [Anaerolineae bacterium]|nr:SUMF1/EgtB/PvdO family nonheme iron enzyme [Anaerolineae bacterium]